MRIRTLIGVGTLVSALAIGGGGAGHYLSFVDLRSALHKQELARDITGAVVDLTMLTGDYLLYREPRAREQWLSRHESLGRILAERGELLGADGERWAALVEDFADIGARFRDLLAVHAGDGRPADESPLRGPVASAQVERRLTAQFLATSQHMASTASVLGLEAQVEVEEKARRAAVFAMFAVAGFAISLSATVFLVAYRVVGPLQQLGGGFGRVGGGDLSHRIGSDNRDEIGDLSRSFDDMTGKLQRLTEVQEAEISARILAEENLRRMMRNLERSNEELEQFAYIASHDLQEPLRMVNSYVQLLARRYADKLDDDANKFIDFAVDGATRMQTLIDGLLFYSRVRTKGEEPQLVDSDGVLDATLRLMAQAIEESGATVTRDPLPRVMADEVQLGQVFQNLIGNAIKFRGHSVPKVHVSATVENGFARFTVRDNGIGIDAKYTDKVFQIFQRLHTRDKYAGTGIGLAVCKRIIERHSGRIWFESSPGEGTTFSFTMPLAHEACEEGWRTS